MVKEIPRILLSRRIRRIRRKDRMGFKNKQIESLKENINTSSSSSPSLPCNPLKRQSPSPSSSPPLPPPPFPSSPSPSSSSPLPPPPCPSLSPPSPKFSPYSPEPISRKRQKSLYRSISDAKSPEFLRPLSRNAIHLSQLPPLPPPAPFPKMLRRAVSDPAPLRLPVSDTQGLRRVCKNLGQINKVFDEITNENGKEPASKDDQGRERKMRRRTVGVQRMEDDWTMIKISCPCGLDYQLIVSEVEKKCFFKLA